MGVFLSVLSNEKFKNRIEQHGEEIIERKKRKFLLRMLMSTG